MSKLSMTDDEIRTRYKAEAIAAWNTRTAPRFTEVEREAIEDALIPMKIMLQSEKINFPNFHRERIEKYEKNIATVRKMLAESEGEK